MGIAFTDEKLHPVIPRVRCPRCGTRMRLAEIGPDNFNREHLKFDCDCGFEYQMAANVQDELRNNAE